MRPRGRPPTPSAMSRPSEPVGMTCTSGGAVPSPSRMMPPLPNCFSMAETARSMALSRWTSRGARTSRRAARAGCCCRTAAHLGFSVGSTPWTRGPGRCRGRRRLRITLAFMIVVAMPFSVICPFWPRIRASRPSIKSQIRKSETEVEPRPRRPSTAAPRAAHAHAAHRWNHHALAGSRRCAARPPSRCRRGGRARIERRRASTPRLHTANRHVRPKSAGLRARRRD